jgi:hypothetical protein
MISVKQRPVYPLIYSLSALNYYAIDRRFIKAYSYSTKYLLHTVLYQFLYMDHCLNLYHRIQYS